MRVRDEITEQLPVWIWVGNDGGHHIVKGTVVFLGESDSADEDGQESNSGREDVGAAIHRQASSLFWRHVLRGAADARLCWPLGDGRFSAVHGGDVEVEQHGEHRLSDTVGRKTHADVVRLYVRVNESRCMNGFESVQQAGAEQEPARQSGDVNVPELLLETDWSEPFLGESGSSIVRNGAFSQRDDSRMGNASEDCPLSFDAQICVPLPSAPTLIVGEDVIVDALVEHPGWCRVGKPIMSLRQVQNGIVRQKEDLLDFARVQLAFDGNGNGVFVNDQRRGRRHGSLQTRRYLRRNGTRFFCHGQTVPILHDREVSVPWTEAVSESYLMDGILVL